MYHVVNPKEENRLRELYRYDILDSEPEPAFNRIVRLAQEIYEVPYVLITFIDRDRQWFKASIGVVGCETDLASSFCTHAIQHDEVMVIHDTIKDRRFVGMPVVNGPPNYRFYAGAPLRTPQGHRLGTICILDKVPHPDFSDEAKAILADLAAVVISELELRMTATASAHQQLVKITTILDNITKVVRHQQDELLRVNRLKDEFYARMSHELRTPLTAIIGFSEILKEDDEEPLDQRKRDYVEVISAAGRHLLALTNDLLDLSKIEAEMMETNLEVVDVPLIIKDACSIVESQARQKRLSLTTSFTPTKPLRVDARKLRQILYNLLMNAVKYTPAGGSIDLRVEEDPYEVRFEVRDTGVGINDKDKERLFQPFIQLENSPDSEFQGTGLGLALVKQLVELHRGKLWVDSQAGVGSTFGFSIPRIEDSLTD
jgi:signal transduction histidine kinase